MNKHLLLIIFLVLLVTSLAAAAGDGNIAGRIKSKTTGTVLANATVIIDDGAWGASTDADGKYMIKNVAVGKHTLNVRMMGYQTISKEIFIKANETVTANVKLASEVVKMQGIKISANRARERETPIAFSNISQREIQDKYTTEDIPDLLDNVPGVFSSSSGLGESELYIRGFDAEKIQVLINGIPVNDPESQVTYWSNWTGLSSNVKSIQVQRGAGSSLYGSGAFGGSLNIETMDSATQQEFILRSSVGYYTIEGAVADGHGGKEEFTPVNYNLMMRYKSGVSWTENFNFSLMGERKGGDSYLNGTYYDGWSYGSNAQFLLGNHDIHLSFIGSPQKHNKVSKYTKSDQALMEILGREYNRNKGNYKNFYYKPQFSVRDEWKISENQFMNTNIFATAGRGGSEYLSNDYFDTKTGAVSAKEVSENITNTNFGEHARWTYETTGVVLQGYDPDAKTYNGVSIIEGNNLIMKKYDQSWKNKSHNDHVQFGINTYYQHKLDELLEVTVGGEARNWNADHYAESFDFHYYDNTMAENLGMYKEVQRRYDYSSTVNNYSGFMRLQIKPTEELNILADGQYAHYVSKVEENPVHLYDFHVGAFRPETFYTTKSMKDADGNPLFKDSDYEKTFKFFSPKFGANYNVNDELNLLVNFSISYKEPKVSNWYSSKYGPNVFQEYSYETAGGVKIEGKEDLKPEKMITYETGFGYDEGWWNVQSNVYYTLYEDKIERVKDEFIDLTINAGRALHKGIELSGGVKKWSMDLSGSFTFSQNRWKKINYETIFEVPAEDVVGKVVPFAPEIMGNLAWGYTIKDLPIGGKLRIGADLKYWDRYFGTYTNTDMLTDVEGNLITGVSARLPRYIQLDNSIKYSFDLFNKKETYIRLNFNNVLNEDNTSSANYSSDYNRNDNLAGTRHMYVTPAPLFNVFLTTEIKF